MIVAITGGTGFVGKQLLSRHLEKGDNVRVLSRRPLPVQWSQDRVRLYRADLTNQESDLLPFVDGADVLYHCAGELIDATRMHALHVLGTQRLIDAAYKRIGHWVQLSSTGAYGHNLTGTVTEETPLNPANIYEITKTESDKRVTAAGTGGAFTYTILRPSIIFGSSMPNQSLFRMIDMISRGLFFFIGQPGASANYIHLNNVVEGLICCGTMPSAKGKTYILSDHRTMEDFVGFIAKALGKPSPTLRLPEQPVRLIARHFGKLPFFPLRESRVNALVGRSIYSIKHMQQDLHYQHKVSMEEGLLDLIQGWSRRK